MNNLIKKGLLSVLLLLSFSHLSYAMCYTITNLQGGNVSKIKNYGFSADRYSNTNFYLEDNNGKVWLDTSALQDSYKDYRLYKLNQNSYEGFYSQGDGITKIDFDIDPQSGKVIYLELKSGWGIIDGAKIMVGNVINTTEGMCPRS